METIKNLHVFYHGRKVGQMALYKGHLAAFQYEKSWQKGCTGGSKKYWHRYKKAGIIADDIEQCVRKH